MNHSSIFIEVPAHVHNFCCIGQTKTLKTQCCYQVVTLSGDRIRAHFFFKFFGHFWIQCKSGKTSKKLLEWGVLQISFKITIFIDNFFKTFSSLNEFVYVDVQECTVSW